MDEIKKISLEELMLYTQNFSKENFIGYFQFGKLYRGKIGERDVTIKIWKVSLVILSYPEDNIQRFNEELMLYGDSGLIRLKSHPYLAVGKLIEYCSEHKFGVVYELKPRDTLRNFILRYDFTWQQRMKIAIQLPAMLGFIHAKCSENLPYVICNLDPARILLDQEYNPVVCDLSMMSGGVLRDKNNWWRPAFLGSYGYIDWCHEPHTYWTEKSDVFAFGCILIGLISKYVYEIEKALEVREGDLASYDSFIAELSNANVPRFEPPLWLREEPLMADEWIKEAYEGWKSSSHSEENFQLCMKA
ncbi:hypothetical protein SLE2022_271630 [Rubroshorea leprosula]